jgi:putative membrane protein
MAERPANGAGDYLAAERTFLAWIRTGIALIAFGFVVARFGLFLETLQSSQVEFPARPFGPSFWFGTGLILLGVLVNVACAWRHVRLVHQLNRRDATFHRPSSLAITVAAILAVLGLAMAVYLIDVHDPAHSATASGEQSRP